MSESPHGCPCCGRAFAWGDDADSSIVDAQGPQWAPCRSNAHWKLTFHMKAEHADALMKCPRRDESFDAVSAYPLEDYWYDGDGSKTCSYCGSLHPDVLFDAIGKGYKLGPTDKSYKVYVDLPHPRAGEPIEIGSYGGPTFDRDGKPSVDAPTDEEISTGRYRRPIMGVARATKQGKFYFQHLSKDQQQQFIELVNAKRVNIGHPGFFYSRPFFCQRVSAAA